MEWMHSASKIILVLVLNFCLILSQVAERMDAFTSAKRIYYDSRRIIEEGGTTKRNFRLEDMVLDGNTQLILSGSEKKLMYTGAYSGKN